MAFSLLYLAVRALLGALLRSRRGLHVKDIELLVLRHELDVLHQQTLASTLGHTFKCSSATGPIDISSCRSLQTATASRTRV